MPRTSALHNVYSCCTKRSSSAKTSEMAFYQSPSFLNETVWNSSGVLFSFPHQREWESIHGKTTMGTFPSVMSCKITSSWVLLERTFLDKNYSDGKVFPDPYPWFGYVHLPTQSCPHPSVDDTVMISLNPRSFWSQKNLNETNSV